MPTRIRARKSQALVPLGARRVLDLGCASGALGAALKARASACEVVGVEVDPATRATRPSGWTAWSSRTSPSSRHAVRSRPRPLRLPDRRGRARAPASIRGRCCARCPALLEPGARAVDLPSQRAALGDASGRSALRGTWPRRPAGHLRRARTCAGSPSATSTGSAARPGWRSSRSCACRGPARPRGPRRSRGVRAFGAFQHVVVARKPA